ncbi:MAG TPA: Ig-like domain-containing protein, partial [Planctomycetota bacterium]|nr:Ig-like domain-containing protein [Planctomycetota bacterium]
MSLVSPRRSLQRSSSLLFLVILFLAIAPVHAEDIPPELNAYLAAQRAAAAQAAQREAKAQPSRSPVAAHTLQALALGTPGAITIGAVSLVTPANATAVPRFAKVELLVSIPTLSATKPFDPSPANGGIDLSAQFTGPGGVKAVKGYWDGTDWRIRFAPHEVGAWTYSVSASDSSGTASWSGGTFTCVASTARGFLRVNGASLDDGSTGRPFIGIGHNVGWQIQVEHPALSGETPATNAYGTVTPTPLLPASRAMAANGENLLVFWLSTPWELPSGSFPHRALIESASTGIGIYNQPPCQYLDQLLDKANAAGVRLLPAIWPHDAVRSSGSPWGAANWSANAYSTICAAADFTTLTAGGGGDTPQWVAQKNFFRYLTARYGYSTALAGWIGVEGIDGMDAWAANSTAVRSWCGAVETWFAQNDVVRSNGASFPLTFNGMTGSSHFMNESSIRSNNNWNAPTSNLGIATELGQQTLQLAGKPHYHNEFAGSISGGATQPTHLHNGIWADLAAGANLTPMVWGDGQAYPRLTDGTTGAAMQSHLRWLSQFIAQVPWAGWYAATSARISDSNLAAWYTNVTDRGYGWAYCTDGSDLGARALHLTASIGRYTVWWFNPNADCTTPIATTSVTSTTSDLTLVTPTVVTGLKDVAWHYQKHPTVNVGLTQNLVGGIPSTLTLSFAPSYNWMAQAVITSLPANVRLYHTSDGVTLGAQILSVPAVVPTAPLRVIAVSDNVAGVRTFGFFLTEVGTASDPATMTLALAINQPPVANSAALTLAENSPQSVTLTGSDPEGQPISFQVQTQPAHGVLSGTAPNLTYTSVTNYHGDDSFTFIVNDGVQPSTPSTVVIHVAHSDATHNQPPVANGATLTLDENTPHNVILTGSDHESQPITFQVQTQPLHGTLSGTAPN